LLPGTTFESAKIVANNLKNAIAEHTFNSVKGSITASFGVAVCSDEDNQEKLFKRVDKALYKAKNSGRNLVVGEDEL